MQNRLWVLGFTYTGLNSIISKYQKKCYILNNYREGVNMNKNNSVLICLLFFMLSLNTKSHTEEFPIFIYQELSSGYEFQNKVKLDSMMSRLNQFGVNHIIGFPDEEKYEYDTLYGLTTHFATYHVKLIPTGGYIDKSVRISDTTPFDFSSFIFNSIYYPYIAGNNIVGDEDFGWGYVFDDYWRLPLTGMQYSIGDHYVRYASASLHNEGYLCGRQWWNSELQGIDKAYGYYGNTWVERFLLKARYRIKLDQRPVDTTEVIGKIILKNRAAYDNLYTSIPNNVAICDTCFKKPLDSCLMIDYDTLISSDLTDTTIIKYFIDTSLEPDCVVDGRKYGPMFEIHNGNTVITNSGDTIIMSGTFPSCTTFTTPGGMEVSGLPTLIVKDLYSSDFPSTGEYYVDTIDYLASREPYHTMFYFMDADGTEIYLDSIVVTNNTARAFLELDESQVNSRISSYLDSLNGGTGYLPKYWYIQDEPWATYACFTKANKILNAGDSLGRFTTTLTTTGADIQLPTYFKYMTLDGGIFDHIKVEMYVHEDDITSASGTGMDSTDIQFKLNQNANKLKLIQDSISSLNSDYSYLGLDAKMWVDIGAFRECDSVGGEIIFRGPSPNEAKVLIYLALAYGTKGIGYYTYGSYNPPITGKYEPLPRPDIILEALESEDYKKSSCPCDMDYRVRGLTIWDTVTVSEDLIYTEQWDSCKVVNNIIHDNESLLLDLEWEEAGSSKNVANLTGSFVDSISGDSAYPWIEAAFFEDSNNDNYLMLVNRRSLANESQYARIFVSDSGVYEIWDAFTNTYDTVFDSSGVIKHSVYLPPAEAALLRFKYIHNNDWFGSLSRDWVWPDYSTINVKGDITVVTTKSLKIEDNANISISSCFDTTSGGNYANKVEFFIYGDMRIEGSVNSRINLGTPGDSIGWYGMNIYGGSLYLNYVDISNASMPIFKYYSSSNDTIMNSTISDCDYGIYCYESDSMYMALCDMDDIEYYGITLYNSDSIIIDNCDFTDVSTGVYAGGTGSNLTLNSIAMELTYDIENSVGLNLSSTDGSMSGTEINNYWTGVKIQYGDDFYIYQSAIYADSKDTADAPFMHFGVDAHSTSNANCKIRKTCFEDINEIAVCSNGFNIDLGTASDSGKNSFYVEGLNTNPNYFPVYFVQNEDTPGDTTACIYNYYDLQPSDSTFEAKLASKMSGDIIYSPYVGMPSWGTCIHHGTGGSSKEYQADKEMPILPDEYSIRQNYPNPFNPVTIIEYALPKASEVKIDIYNILGQHVKTVENSYMAAGIHSVIWDGKNNLGHQVSSGIYLYKITAGEYEESKKMIILK